jgi:predicted alpha/beta-fold hydrolase
MAGEVTETDGFRPGWWLPGPHLQTMWGRLMRSRFLVDFTREALPTPDGDTLLLDHLEGSACAPHVILLHGLEGSSFSVYIQGLALLARNLGWRATALNFRSCARETGDRVTFIANDRPRLYHSGETADFDLVVKTLAAREPGTPLSAIGVSLGGNVLLKWLGENPGQHLLRRAAVISVPYDLAAGARFMETGLGPLYVASFLRTLTQKGVDLVARFPEAASRIDVERMRRARTFWEFDHAATGPLHGFAGADDYYSRSSSLGFLPRITVPVLCINAGDDPFLPGALLPAVKRAAPPNIETRFTKRGGHAGFVGGPWPVSPYYWAEEATVSWLRRRV